MLPNNNPNIRNKQKSIKKRQHINFLTQLKTLNSKDAFDSIKPDLTRPPTQFDLWLRSERGSCLEFRARSHRARQCCQNVRGPKCG